MSSRESTPLTGSFMNPGGSSTVIEAKPEDTGAKNAGTSALPNFLRNISVEFRGKPNIVTASGTSEAAPAGTDESANAAHRDGLRENGGHNVSGTAGIDPASGPNPNSRSVATTGKPSWWSRAVAKLCCSNPSNTED
ncbi:hypothetical protein PsYK624_023740 [Phanerochaete sordida]|uniref:Uncharacterized protein n=1 Tax=Phanerochaete sordida TaxID=48140 RepID=A0A9P3G1R7_9APHY|nr:hypothetical protein PsYK624_023740 [Phanerochaete sordida]